MEINFDVLLKKLMIELEFDNMGDFRLYKWINYYLNDHDKVTEFMINKLGFKRYQVNRIYRSINLRKQRYINKGV